MMFSYMIYDVSICFIDILVYDFAYVLVYIVLMMFLYVHSSMDINIVTSYVIKLHYAVWVSCYYHYVIMISCGYVIMIL